MDLFKKADQNGQLEHAKEWQVIDLEKVEKELEESVSPRQKMEYLSEAYPSLFIFVLEHLKMPELIELYMQRCKCYEDDVERYSLYVHGYFLPWLN